jgi:hypothetical protein
MSIGSMGAESLLNDLAVANRIVCISSSRGGPWLVEDSPVGEPHLVGSFSTPGVTEAATVSGELLAVAGARAAAAVRPAGTHGLVPLTLPEPVGALPTWHSPGTSLTWRPGATGPGLDLSDPRAPVEIARAATIGPCYRVVVDNDFLYATVASSPYVSTAIFDVSDPTVPRQVAELEGGVLAVAEGYAHTDWSDWAGRCALATWDVSNPQQPATQPSRINFFGGCDRCGCPGPTTRGPTSSRTAPSQASRSRGSLVALAPGFASADMTDPASRTSSPARRVACGTGHGRARDTAFATTAPLASRRWWCRARRATETGFRRCRVILLTCFSGNMPTADLIAACQRGGGATPAAPGGGAVGPGRPRGLRPSQCPSPSPYGRPGSEPSPGTAGNELTTSTRARATASLSHCRGALRRWRPPGRGRRPGSR